MRWLRAYFTFRHSARIEAAEQRGFDYAMKAITVGPTATTEDGGWPGDPEQHKAFGRGVQRALTTRQAQRLTRSRATATVQARKQSEV